MPPSDNLYDPYRPFIYPETFREETSNHYNEPNIYPLSATSQQPAIPPIQPNFAYSLGTPSHFHSQSAYTPCIRHPSCFPYFPANHSIHHLQPATFSAWPSYGHSQHTTSPQVFHGSKASPPTDPENLKQSAEHDTNDSLWINAEVGNAEKSGDGVNENGDDWSRDNDHNNGNDTQDCNDDKTDNSNGYWGKGGAAENQDGGAGWDSLKSTGGDDWNTTINNNTDQLVWDQAKDYSAHRQSTTTNFETTNTSEQLPSFRDLYGPYGPYYTSNATSSDTPRPDVEEEPRFDVPKVLADATGSTMQVQPGAGYKYFKKRCCPEYIDNLDQPYARFVFKYRTKDQIRNEFGIDVDVEPSSHQEIQELQTLDKQALIEMLIRAKSALGGRVPSPTNIPAAAVPNDRKRVRTPPDMSFLRYNMPPSRTVTRHASQGGVTHHNSMAKQNKSWSSENVNEENINSNWYGSKSNDRTSHSHTGHQSAAQGTVPRTLQSGSPLNWTEEVRSKTADVPFPPKPITQQARKLSPPLQQEPWTDCIATNGNMQTNASTSGGDWGNTSNEVKKPRGGW